VETAAGRRARISSSSGTRRCRRGRWRIGTSFELFARWYDVVGGTDDVTDRLGYAFVGLFPVAVSTVAPETISVEFRVTFLRSIFLYHMRI